MGFVNWLKDLWQGIVSLDWKWIILAILFLSVIAIALILLFTFLYRQKKEKEFEEQVIFQKDLLWVYRIDLTMDEVRFFSMANIDKVKVMTSLEFYASYPAGEGKRVQEWIEDSLDPKKNVADYLQLDVFWGPDKKVVPAFLKITHKDSSARYLHIESYLLSPEKKSNDDKPLEFKTERAFADVISAQKEREGMTFCFMLVPRPTGNEEVNLDRFREKLPAAVSIRFAKALSPYLRSTDMLIRSAPNELILAFFHTIGNADAIKYALSVVRGMTRTMNNERKKREPHYLVRAGIVINPDVIGESDSILAEARRAATNSFETNVAVSVYNKLNDDFAQSHLESYRNEVERIIYEKRIAYTFRPVVSVEKEKAIGYLAKATPVNTPYASMEEFKNYAARAHDERALFSANAKTIIPRFIDQRENAKQVLFFPLSFAEIKHIKYFVGRFKKAKEAIIAFALRESEIMNNIPLVGVDTFLETMAAAKSSGIKIALILEGESLMCDPEIYPIWDYFIVAFSSSFDGMDGENRKLRSQLHALVERLLKYNKPIIGDGLMSWTALELVVGSGLEYISSDAFCPYDPMIRPLPEKSLQRLRLMKERK